MAFRRTARPTTPGVGTAANAVKPAAPLVVGRPVRESSGRTIFGATHGRENERSRPRTQGAGSRCRNLDLNSPTRRQHLAARPGGRHDKTRRLPLSIGLEMPLEDSPLERTPKSANSSRQARLAGKSLAARVFGARWPICKQIGPICRAGTAESPQRGPEVMSVTTDHARADASRGRA